MTIVLILSCALTLAIVMVGLLVVHPRLRAVLAGPRLTGETVVVEREGREVVNLRGIVVAQHADRLTLSEAQAIGPDGDVPLEHAVVHVPSSVILSISIVEA